MSKALYGVYGASGLGRQVMPLARAQLISAGSYNDNLVFIDDSPKQSILNGQRVLSFDEFIQDPDPEKYIVIAIASSQIRSQIAKKITQHKILPWSVQDENVVIMDDVEIGEGAILSSFVLLTSNISIGKYFQANHYSHVAHDCVIGDFVTFGPGVRCNGNVVIKDHAYIGTGAMLRQGTESKPLVIGENAVVGMGAVVTKDVPPNTTVVGNPARPLVK